VGRTNSIAFPTTLDAFSRNVSGRDGFVTRLSPDGASLSYSTFLGGSGVDIPTSIVLDSAGNAYVTGETESPNFPFTNGTWDTDFDDSSADVNDWTDSFVVRFVWPSDLSVAPVDIAFVPPLAVNPGENLIIEATVHNEGDGVASAVRVRFLDGLPTGGVPIGTDQLIPVIAASGGIGRASVTWTASPPGPHEICVVVDPANGIDELNESNNEACATIQVSFGPITALLIGQPNYTAADTYVTSVTSLSLSVLDRNGTGIKFSRYRIDNAPWVDYLGPFSLLDEGEHLLEWYSEDNTDTREEARSLRLLVDDTPPSTTLAIGEPKFVAVDTFVNSSTALALAPADAGAIPVGVALTEYRLDGGAWIPYAAPFTLAGPDGARTLEYRATDHLGNAATGTRRVVLDNTPPSTTHAPDRGPFDTATRFTLSVSDGGSGVDRVEYHVDGGSWIPYEVGFSLPEGDHVVVYSAWDRLNNKAVERTFSVTIVTPPVTSFPLIWIVLAVTVGIAVSISWLFEFLRRSFWIPFAVMWARLSHGDILDHKKRGMVVGYLAANPAANFAAIRADLKMAMGTLTYHLWVLEKEGEIKSWRDGRFRRYAPHGHRVAEMQPRLTDIELLLLQRIRGTSGLTQKELAKDVGVSQPAVSYHINRMAALGVLRVERRGRGKRYMADLGDLQGDAGSQADRDGVTDPEPVDKTDDWGAPR
jgi:predicted transcriptional regulator